MVEGDQLHQTMDTLDEFVDSAKFRECSQSEEDSEKHLLSWNKTYECQVCYLTFFTGYALRRHIATYEDRRYPCEKCSIKFSSTRLLRSHIALTHEGLTCKRYNLRCPVCNQLNNLESSLQSHLCHYHSNWKGLSPLTASETTSPKFRKENLIRVIKNVVKVCKREPRRSTPGHTPVKTKLQNSIGIQGWCESKPVNIRERETPKKSLCGFKYNRRLRVVRSKTGKQSVQRTLFDVVKLESKVLSHESLRNTITKSELSESTQLLMDSSKDQDSVLCVSHSCKECYVPLMRIDSLKNDAGSKPIAVEKSSDNIAEKKTGEKLKTLENRTESLNKTHSPKKKQEEESSKEKCFRLLDLKVHLEKLSHPEMYTKSKKPHNQSTETSWVEADQENHSVNHITTEATNNSSSNNDKGALRNPEDIRTPEVPEENTESCLSPSLLPKIEPMDYTTDDYSEPEREPPVPSPEPPNDAIKMETAEEDSETTDYEAHSSGVLQEAFNEPMDTSGEMWKVEIGEEFPSDSAAISSSTDPVSPTSSSENRLEQESRPISRMVSSKICDKLFACRRTMMRHLREQHLTSFADTVYCTCGKEMIGRRALENHFSRHCDKFIETTEPPSNAHSPCRLLEKNYACEKCGQKFWLETCLKDHLPNCELPRVKQINDRQNRVTDNFLNDSPPVRELVCRVCDVKFPSEKKLSQHERTYLPNGQHPCPFCSTVFVGPRLLKGHVQSTHEPNSATYYTYFCDFCCQGFTKKIYKRMHTMHVHRKEASSELERLILSPANGPPEVTQRTTTSTILNNRCEVCNLIFVGHKRYLDHVAYYDRNVLIRCSLCREVFEGQYAAHHHRKSVHYAGNASSYAHHCAVCQEGFMWKTHLHAHKVHVHDCEIRTTNSLEDPSSAANDGRPLVPRVEDSQAYFRRDSILAALLHSQHLPSSTLYSSNSTLEKLTNNNSLGFAPRDVTSPAVPIDLTDERNNVTEPWTRSSDRAIPENSSELAKILSRCNACGSDSSELVPVDPSLSNECQPCELCGERFRWPSRHPELEVSSREKSCFCPICDERFERLESLEKHTKDLHRDPKDLEKLQLFEDFSPRSDHLERNDEPLECRAKTLLLPFECPFCKRTYETLEKLGEHRAEVHGGESLENNLTIGEEDNDGLHSVGCRISDDVFLNADALGIGQGDCRESSLQKNEAGQVVELEEPSVRGRRSQSLTDNLVKRNQKKASNSVKNPANRTIADVVFLDDSIDDSIIEISNKEERSFAASEPVLQEKPNSSTNQKSTLSQNKTESSVCDVFVEKNRSAVEEDKTSGCQRGTFGVNEQSNQRKRRRPIIEESEDDNESDEEESISSWSSSVGNSTSRRSPDARRDFAKSSRSASLIDIDDESDQEESISSRSSVVGSSTSGRSTDMRLDFAKSSRPASTITIDDESDQEESMSSRSTCVGSSTSKANTDLRLDLAKSSQLARTVDKRISSLSSVEIAPKAVATVKNPFSGESAQENGLTHRKRLINLPPGNYKISKLKVRPVRASIGTLLKNNNEVAKTRLAVSKTNRTAMIRNLNRT